MPVLKVKKDGVWETLNKTYQLDGGNADTLDGRHANEFASLDDIAQINSLLHDMQAKAGFIYPLASSIVPDGFLLCDGAEYSRVEYPELFLSIGTTFGAGDGSSTFNVPNLSTRVPVGSGTGYALGATGGNSTVYVNVNNLPRDVITFCAGETGDWSTGAWSNHDIPSTWISRPLSQQDVDYGQPLNNMQPYTVVNYIIATGKNTGISTQDIIMGAQAIPLGVEFGGTGANNIATARSNLGAQSQHLTATVTIPANGWSSNSQTVSVDGVTNDNTVIVVSSPSNSNVYSESGILCISQGKNALTFSCDSRPQSDVQANVIILD